MKVAVILYTSKEYSNGEYPLMLRLAEKKNKKYISLGITLPKSNWNFDKNSYINTPIPKDATEVEANKIKLRDAKIRSIISEAESKYLTALSEQKLTGKRITLDTLQKNVEKPISHEYTLFSWYDFIIDDFEHQDNLGQKAVYKGSLASLKGYLKDKDVTFDEIDLPFLKGYERYLKQPVKKRDGTDHFKTGGGQSIYLRTFRSALNKAIASNHAKNYPFKDIKLPKGKPSRRALEPEDLEAMMKLSKEETFFKMFVFMYYLIGINYVDLIKLTWHDVKSDEIIYTRQKIRSHPNSTMKIAIHREVRKILDYYRPKTGQNERNYIFPILDRNIHVTEQQKADRKHKTLGQFNKYLKEIAAEAEVKENVTSYTLRHTVLTKLINSDVNINTIQALAGHTSIATTQLYFKEAQKAAKAIAVNLL
jgi:integrase